MSGSVDALAFDSFNARMPLPLHLGQISRGCSTDTRPDFHISQLSISISLFAFDNTSVSVLVTIPAFFLSIFYLSQISIEINIYIYQKKRL